MKRDFGLIRQILIELENIDEYLKGYETLTNNIVTDINVLDEHILLLHQANYIEAKNIETDYLGDLKINPYIRLTWAGHEFLQQIKNETVWDQINSKLTGMKSFSIPIIQNLAVEILKNMLK